MIGGMQVQPSEFAKIALVLALAAWFSRISYARMANPLWLVPPALMVLVPVALVLKEPNLGTAVIIGGVGASLFFAAGMRLWLIGLLALPVPYALKLAYSHLHDYQRARITTFMNPESDPLGRGTTSSSPKSRWVRVACGGRATCTARRDSSTSCLKNRPISSLP